MGTNANFHDQILVMEQTLEKFMANEVKLQERDSEAKLLFPDFQGGHHAEYLPGDYSRFSQKVRDYYVAYRSKFGFQIYYWQVRFIFPLKDRKVYDLHFMAHVRKDHSGQPKTLLERLHYRLASAKYGREFGFVMSMSMLDWQMEHSKDPYLQKSPYVKAYKKKWIDNFNESPDWKLLYHGVHILEFGSVLENLNVKNDYRRRHFKKFSDTNEANNG